MLPKKYTLNINCKFEFKWAIVCLIIFELTSVIFDILCHLQHSYAISDHKRNHLKLLYHCILTMIKVYSNPFKIQFLAFNLHGKVVNQIYLRWNHSTGYKFALEVLFYYTAYFPKKDKVSRINFKLLIKALFSFQCIRQFDIAFNKFKEKKSSIKFWTIFEFLFPQPHNLDKI